MPEIIDVRHAIVVSNGKSSKMSTRTVEIRSFVEITAFLKTQTNQQSNDQQEWHLNSRSVHQQS